jgi:hypothetical protein
MFLLLQPSHFLLLLLAAFISLIKSHRLEQVVLGLEWSYPCDMWSVACIILELHEGCLTFDTHDTAQHMAMIERLCGPTPK